MSNNNNGKDKRAKAALGPKKAAGKKKASRKNRPGSGNPRQPRDVGSASVFAPVAQGTVIRSVKPMFMRQSRDEQRIVHREKVGKYTTPGTGTFTVLASVAIQPGLVTSFPWLANEAAGWETYRFNRLRYVWVPTSGTAVAGNIIMGPDYDAADAAPGNETALSSYSDTQEANVWVPFASELNPADLNGEQRRRFIRNGALAANLDIKTYDSGNFFVASADDAAANSGKLWVEYDISLYNPQVPPGGFQAAGTLLGAGGSLAAATPFGAVPVASGPIGLNAAATNTLSFTGLQVGQEISLMVAITGTVITAFSVGTLVGLAAAKTSIFGGFPAAATSACQVYTFIVTGTAPTLNVNVTATTVTAAWATCCVLAPIPTF